MTDRQKFVLALLRDAIIVLFLVLNLILMANGHSAIETSILTFASQSQAARPCPSQVSTTP